MEILGIFSRWDARKGMRATDAVANFREGVSEHGNSAHFPSVGCAQGHACDRRGGKFSGRSFRAWKFWAFFLGGMRARACVRQTWWQIFGKELWSTEILCVFSLGGMRKGIRVADSVVNFRGRILEYGNSGHFLSWWNA